MKMSPIEFVAGISGIAQEPYLEGLDKRRRVTKSRYQLVVSLTKGLS